MPLPNNIRAAKNHISSLLLRPQRHPAGIMVDLVEDLESGQEADRMQRGAQERYRIEGCFFLYGDPSRPCRASGSTQ